MAIWIVTSICILLITITALVKVKAFFGKVFVIILGLAGLAGSYLAHDRYESLMTTLVSAITPGDSGSADPDPSTQPNTSDSLAVDIATKRRQLDSLNTRYEQVNRQVTAAVRRRDSITAATNRINGSTTNPKPAITASPSPTKLGARLGESIRMPDGKFRRIDVFRGISPGDIKNVSIHMQFDNRFDGLVISQEGPDGIARGDCPRVDTVYSSAFFDYKCDLLSNGSGIVVTTFSEFPLKIEDISIQPK